MLDERRQLIGENEGLFRSVNESVRPLDPSWMTILCECGDRACRDQVTIARAEYARVREDSALFVLRPGHQIEAAEHVIAKHVEFWVVRKHPGLPASIAQAIDPNRSP